MEKKLAPYFVFAGKHIKWSTAARANVKTEMYALMQTYGPATWFVTMSPPMQDNWLAQKLASRKTCDMTDDGRDAEEWTPDNDANHRSVLAAQNPVDVVRVCGSFPPAREPVEVVCTCIGSPPDCIRTAFSVSQGTRRTTSWFRCSWMCSCVSGHLTIQAHLDRSRRSWASTRHREGEQR